VKLKAHTRSEHHLSSARPRQLSSRNIGSSGLYYRPSQQLTEVSEAGFDGLPTGKVYDTGDGLEYCTGGRFAECTPIAPVAAPAALPQVTPGMVLTAMRSVGLPSLQAHTQPADKTLVNFPTIFYASPQGFTRTVTLLGRPVEIRATARSFTWHYGDGTTATTARPGAPYPAMDVTHSYTDAHTTVLTSVDVTYSGEFRVGGGWQAIPGTVTIAGPTAPLRVSEATAVLSGTYQ
jgi:hypothetical protein